MILGQKMKRVQEPTYLSEQRCNVAGAFGAPDHMMANRAVAFGQRGATFAGRMCL